MLKRGKTGVQQDPLADAQLGQLIGSCFADPLKHVMVSYPWRSEPAIQKVKLKGKWAERFDSEFGPDEWACEYLDDLGSEIRSRAFDGQHAVPPIRMSTASGHGIGKSMLAAFLIRFVMDTRPYSKGTITANTDVQLRTKTWAELGKWHNMALTRHWWEYSSSKGNMSYRSLQMGRDKESGLLVPLHDRWFCTAQTSREENSESFAGQHAPEGTSFYLFDEASGIPDKIYEVREGGLTDGHPMVFDFGNPTRNSGAFYENTVGRMRHRYIVRSIDSRTVQITNKALHKQWAEDYGEDSDFFKVRVKGQFPSAGSMQFIAHDIVEQAMKRDLKRQDHMPLVIGVDVARFGDDESVIYPRMGLDARSFMPRRFRGLDTVALSGKIMEMMREFAALGKPVKAVFVDGAGTGSAVVDILRSLGHPVHEIWFSGKPNDPQTYRYKTDEMWGSLRDELKRGLCLPQANTPSGPDLQVQLTQREYGFSEKGQIMLERKRDMKERLQGVQSDIGSPDIADALALTFAMELGTMMTDRFSSATSDQQMVVTPDYDPLEG